MASWSKRSSLWLDLFERALLVVLYGFLVSRIFDRYAETEHVASLLVLPSEGLVVLFMLIRRPTNAVSRSPGAWALALGATCAPMLVSAGETSSPVVVPFAATLLLVGVIVQVHAKLVLGRSFGCVPANRGIKLGGPYRIVRHPMYAGYLLSHLAYLAINPTLWNFGAYAIAYGLQIPRLLQEEKLLSDDPSYREYQTVVRYRLVPGVF